jgi:hypothetical protein
MNGYLHGFDSELWISEMPEALLKAGDDALGRYYPRLNRIVIRPGLTPWERVSTILHEIGHATMGHGHDLDETDHRVLAVWAEDAAASFLRHFAPEVLPSAPLRLVRR